LGEKIGEIEMRKIIQISTTQDPQGESITVVLCDDGSVWWDFTDNYKGKWRKKMNVPQDDCDE